MRLDLQFYAFFVMILSGAVLGLLYDLLRSTRRFTRPGWMAAAAADLVFWVVATGTLTVSLFYGNWADLRLYVLLGLGLGVVLYLWLGSPIARLLILLIFNLIGMCIKGILYVIERLIWLPLSLLVGVLVRIALALGRLVRGMLARAGRGAGQAAVSARRAAGRVYRVARSRFARRRRPK